MQSKKHQADRFSVRVVQARTVDVLIEFDTATGMNEFFKEALDINFVGHQEDGSELWIIQGQLVQAKVKEQ